MHINLDETKLALMKIASINAKSGATRKGKQNTRVLLLFLISLNFPSSFGILHSCDQVTRLIINIYLTIKAINMIKLNSKFTSFV